MTPAASSAGSNGCRERPGQPCLPKPCPPASASLGVVVLVISLLLFGLGALHQGAREGPRRSSTSRHARSTDRPRQSRAVQRAPRAPPLPLTLLALDLDRFKPSTTRSATRPATSCCSQVAARLKTLVRDTDLVARLGGDEFMILLSGKIRAQAARNSSPASIVDAPWPCRSSSAPISASIGVSVGIATAVTDERKELVSRADFALYDAKESGPQHLQGLRRAGSKAA